MMDQKQDYSNMQAGTVQKKMSLYEEHACAVGEYHSACHDYQLAVTRKLDASAKLQKISKVLGQAIEASLDDPTQPKAPKAEQPAGNGHAQSQLAAQQLQRMQTY